MSDVKRYIQQRVEWDTEFAKNYDTGYAVLKIEHGWTRKEQIRTDSICENLRNLRSDFH